MVHQYHSNSCLLRDTSISARPLAILLLPRICDELQMDVTEGKLVRHHGSSEPKNLTSSQNVVKQKDDDRKNAIQYNGIALQC